MALQMLYVHWKAVRWGLLPFVVAAFGLPLLSVQGLGLVLPIANSTTASMMLVGAATWQPLFPMLAGVVGSLLALSAWNWDHKVGHVYALSLPISRERYAILKFGAGAVLALIPVAALLAGSLVAALSLELPSGLHAYPLALTGRFLFGTLVVYACFFALASGTIRTTMIALSVIFGLPLAAVFAIDLLSGVYPALATVDVGRTMEQALLRGPFRVFYGDWMLIDV
jgi:hypothetical protein